MGSTKPERMSAAREIDSKREWKFSNDVMRVVKGSVRKLLSEKTTEGNEAFLSN